MPMCETPQEPASCRLRLDEDLRRKLSECVRAEQAQSSNISRRAASKSSVIRHAVDMYYQHMVLEHSFIADTDPRFSPENKKGA